MQKKNIIIYVATVIVLIIALIGIYNFLGPKPSEDAVKFKEEYESLNNTTRESDGAKYNTIKIEKNNPIKYIDAKEALKVLDSNQAIIYVGAEWCPWCRNAVPVLFEVAKQYDVDTIYYLNLDNEKSSFEIENGELVEKTKGSKSYYELLEKLSDNLEDYVLTSKDGTKYETGEKRIFMPYVIAVRNGKVVEDHTGTVDLNKNQTKYDPLTDKQHDELYNIYEKMFESVYPSINTTCDEEACY